MHYLLVKIPNLFFLPVAVCVFLGCIAAVLIHKKKHNQFYWCVILAICIMCFWRTAANSLMLSARYSSIFLYPAIIIAIWFCFQTKDYLQWAAGRFPILDKSIPAKVCTAFPYIMLTGLTIACLVKTLHYSPYTNHTVKICRILAEEISDKNYLIYTHTDADRIAYYAGIDIKKVWPLNSWDENKEESIHSLLKQKMLFSRNFIGDIYFFFYLKENEPEPDAQNLGIDPSIGKWEYLHREYTSRRKNKEMVLYRFVPAHPNIEFWEKDIPEMSLDNLYENGDFEQALTGKELEERIAYYEERNASDFYLTPGRCFPKSWWLGVPSQNAEGGSPEIALTDNQPIAGKYSVEINGNGLGLIGMNSVYVPKQNGTLSGYIRAEKNSIVLVSFNYWNKDINNVSNIEQYPFNTVAGKTYQFMIPLHESDIPKNVKSIFTIVQSSGHVLIDNIEFVPNQMEPRQNTP